MRYGWMVLGCLLLTAAWAGSYEDGLDRFRAGRFAEAEALFGQVYEQNPAELGALYWRGRSRAAQEKWGDAIDDYREVLRQKADSQPSRLALAQALESTGARGEALALYRLVLAAEPDNAVAAESVSRLTAAPAPSPTAAATPTREAVRAPVKPVLPPTPAIGTHIAITTEGLNVPFNTLLTDAGLDAESPQLLDYTFGSAPVDWEPTAGVWQVSSRFACDPSWSFFGGYSQGLAAIWNKRQFSGDLVMEAYVSFKHGLPWNPTKWSYRPADLCLTLCGDGENPASGYSFVYAGDEGSRTMIRKGTETLASTSDPQFLSPSYSDGRPSSEDFHRRWWQLVAQKTGHTLRFFVDGKQALEVEDPNLLDGGRVGIWTVHNGMMIARVRIAYQQELRAGEPLIRVAEPAPLPDEPTTVASR